jgi:hypothetical protein
MTLRASIAIFVLILGGCGAQPRVARLMTPDSDGLFDTVSGPPATRVFHFSNVGNAASRALAVTLRGDVAAFSIADDTCSGRVLQPMGECSVAVKLGGGAAGNFIAHLTVSDSSGSASVLIALSGRVTPAQLSVASPAMPSIDEGQMTNVNVTVNNGGGALSGAVTVNMDLGTVVNDECSGHTLVGGGSCTFVVQYSIPLGTTGTIHLTGTVGADPGSDTIVDIELISKSVHLLQAPDMDFGTIDPRNAPYHIIAVTNTGDQPTGPLSVALATTAEDPAVISDPFAIPLGYDLCSSKVLLPPPSPEAICHISVTIDPKLPTPGNYTASLTVSAVGAHPAIVHIKVATVSATASVKINKSGTGDGRITSDVTTSVLCQTGQSYCTSYWISDGEAQTYTAMPAAGSIFGGWDVGPCQGSSNPSCRVTGAGVDVSIDAVFTKQ